MTGCRLACSTWIGDEMLVILIVVILLTKYNPISTINTAYLGFIQLLLLEMHIVVAAYRQRNPRREAMFTVG